MKWLILTALIALAACAEHDRAVDVDRCTGYGFRPGTDQFANCLMYVDQQRRSDSRAAAIGIIQGIKPLPR
jgi:hypothetical protein